MGAGTAETRRSPLLRQIERRDLFWAALLGLWLGLSPTTGSHRAWLSALLGAAAAGIVLAVRLWALRAPRPDADRVGIRMDPVVWTSLLLVVLVFAPTIGWLYGEYTTSLWRNAHGLFVPLFLFLLGRSALRRDPHPDRIESSAWGLVPLALGLGLAGLDAAARTGYLGAVGLVLALPGLTLVFLGARRTRALAGVLALGFFLIPFPQSTADPIKLTEGSAVLAEAIVHAAGLPAIREGTHLITRQAEISVSQNCSGLSTVQAAFALALALSLSASSWRGRLLPLLLAYPVTLALNALRVVGIVWMCHFVGASFLDTALHGFSGLVVFWVGMFVVWLGSDVRGDRGALT